MLKLVEQYKTALGIKLAHYRGSHYKLLRAAHIVPLLPLVCKLAVLNRQPFKRQIRTVKQVVLLLAYIIKFGAESSILVFVALSFFLSLFLIKIRSDFHVDNINFCNAFFKFCR